MSRCILRFRGKGSTPTEDLDRIRKTPQLQVIDASSDRMLLVDGPDESLEKLAGALPQWAMSIERSVPLPDPQVKIRSQPGAKSKH